MAKRNYFIIPNEERFWAKVRKDEGGCWWWTGGQNVYGYGVIGIGGRKGGMERAHGYAWTLLRGPLAEGIHLHHVCLNKLCVNPDHLQPMTNSEHVSLHGSMKSQKVRSRGTCKNGHPWSEETVYIDTSGSWICKECLRPSYRRIKGVRARAGISYTVISEEVWDSMPRNPWSR